MSSGVHPAQAPTLNEKVVKYNSIHATLDKMGKELLKLIRHPDATVEQIDANRQMYYDAYQRWIAARMILREKYPPIKWMPGYIQRELPWNKQEDL